MPLQVVGRLTLDRNPSNFFAETEQVAFLPSNVIPGIDFTNDPLLQGRLFSYLDTQKSRLGTTNFHQIPVNAPKCPFHNFQRDGMHRQDIDTNPANYEPNSINDNWPRETPPGPKRGGFESYQERIDGNKIRERSPSFGECLRIAALVVVDRIGIRHQYCRLAKRREFGNRSRARAANHQIRRRVGLIHRFDERHNSRVKWQASVPGFDRRKIERPGLMYDRKRIFEIDQLCERIQHGIIDPARAGVAAENQ